MNDSKTIGEYTVPEELLARCVGRVDLAKRVLTMFVSQLDEDLPTLADNIEQESADVACKLAHRVKGAAANVAATDICDIAAQIEQTCRSGELESVTGQLTELESACKSYKATVTNFLEASE